MHRELVIAFVHEIVQQTWTRIDQVEN